MGRLRNFSNSIKAAAFNNTNGHGSPSPVSRTREDSPDDVISKKEVPVMAREASSSSVLDSTPASRPSRSHSRPVSQAYTPPTMSAGRDDHIDELKPVFSFLSSHQNKLYQEGYFLKLTDLDTSGKPNADRNWTECFAQLVGTVLSLWDAAALDAAGQDGEVPPSFINLADASVKMIETLPTRNATQQPLQNVLSVSTAGKNRYLFHFNSLHSLTQWTAGIRLAMFEHASLQELYTGSLIAGKGKLLNNIRTIMERSKFVEEDWARVRFGAGTPWRRCWYVVEPPDEKEWQRASKTMRKRGTYERPQYPKGDIKFYDKKKTKKATPIATITNVYSAYAVYPQSKPLMDQSTLVKLEGTITIHSNPESKTEGFVFVMPELHPAVSGFEMMLRFLFPAFDTFSLYGRPNRLIADTLDSRGLMFAMPKDRRYGYLDIMDVAGLIHTEGSDKWTEREWRARMKELVSRRMTMAAQGRASNIEQGSRVSLGSRPGIRYEDSIHRASESPVSRSTDAVFASPQKNYTAASSIPAHLNHSRSISETNVVMSPGKHQRKYNPSRLSIDHDARYKVESPEISPLPPSPVQRGPYKNGMALEREVTSSSNSSNSELGQRINAEQLTHDMIPESMPPAPVNQPYFQHQPSDRPQHKPMDRPDIRREQSRPMSNATLDQLTDASRKGIDAGAAATAAWKTNGRYDGQERGVISDLPNVKSLGDADPFSKELIKAYPPKDLSSNIHHGVDHRPSLASTTPTQYSIPRKPLPFPTTSSSPAEILPYSMLNRDGSPDYASTADSKEYSSQQPQAKRLGGIRKTVGDPALVQEVTSYDIPTVDFGPTQSLTPVSSRPGTASGKRSPLETLICSTPPTPTEVRVSYGDRVSPGYISPLPSPHSRPTSRQKWYPRLATGRQSPGGLTAEEFVQQRAAIARSPGGYATRRTPSTEKALEMVIPPAEEHRTSKLHRRTSSRPLSRGSMLEFGSTLSAREQEHVARITGTPLINIVQNKQTPDPNVGLIGAITAREQGRRDMKEGISSQLAQNAIAQRQQQQQYRSPQVLPIQAQYRPGPNAWSQQARQAQVQQQSGYYSPGSYFPQQQYFQPQQQSFRQSPQQASYMQTQPGNHFYQDHYASQGGYTRH